MKEPRASISRCKCKKVKLFLIIIHPHDQLTNKHVELIGIIITILCFAQYGGLHSRQLSTLLP